MDLTSMSCAPARDDDTPLIRRDIMDLINEVPRWSVEEGRLVRTFVREDFADCLAFVSELHILAKNEGHYPDICIRERQYVEVSWYSYHCGGLTLNDFIMAAKLSAMEYSRKVERL
jgi:4a-hydroxytetrahydrobiopterin dehydratase